MDYYLEITPDFGPDLPVVVQDLQVTLAPPDVGWIDLTLIAGEVRFEASLSYVYDPFEDIVAFLEKVLEGRDAELVIDGEGIIFVFRARKHERDDVLRFGIWWHEGTALGQIVPVLDIGTNRRPFVKAFYTAILSTYAQPDEWTFLCNWLLVGLPDEPWDDGIPWEPNPLRQIRSAILDQVLV